MSPLLEECLTSLTVALEGVPSHGAIVVDNASTAASRDLIRAASPAAMIVPLVKNSGFAGGVSLGMRVAQGEWILLLNNDATLAPDAPAQLLAAGERDLHIGSVAAQMRFARRPDVINSAGLCVDRLGIAYERLLGQPLMASESVPTEVFGASAGAALYRRAMLDDVGGFDESFFAYLEDADVAWRARMRGWKSVYAPEAVVHHHHSATAGHGSSFKYRQVGRNRIRLLAKNATRRQLTASAPAMIGYDLAYSLYVLLADRSTAALAGRIEGLREWRRYRAAGNGRRYVPLSKPLGLRAALRRREAWGSFSAARPARREPVRVGPATLAAGTAAFITLLALMRILEAPRALELVFQAGLATCFVVLCLRDLRIAVGVALFELVLAGAGGQWTVLPGGISGRNFLVTAVTAAAVLELLRVRRGGGSLELGRYGPHAIALGLALPAIWMTMGLARGNAPADVLSDGNGVAFLAFALPLTVLILRGHGAWLRKCFFAACAANAVFTGLLIAISASGAVSLSPTLDKILIDDLDFGGIVGYMPNGAYRLYLGSGLFLQIGLALTTWRLLSDPRSRWLWALYGLLWIDLLATYTRGFWVGAAVSVGVVLLLGARNWREAARIVVPVVSAGAVVMLVALAAGSPLPDRLGTRVSGLFGSSGSSEDRHAPDVLGQAPLVTPGPSTPPAQPGLWRGTLPAPERATPPVGRTLVRSTPAGLPDAVRVPGTGGDAAGEISNELRRQQARVLWRHIRERPIVGHGFGSIAADYPHGTSYSYELSYLDLWYKAGFLGVLLFLSLPVRLALDAVRGRLGRIGRPLGVSGRELSVVAGIVLGLLVVGATNPYLLAAFGITPIIACLAWLEPARLRGSQPA